MNLKTYIILPILMMLLGLNLSIAQEGNASDHYLDSLKKS